LWARVLPDLVVRNELALATGRQIAPAVRHDSPELKAALDAYLAEQGARHRGGAADLIARYHGSVQYVRNANHAPVLRNARELAPHFRHHSDQVGIAWLLMLAQGFQESGLNPEARNPSGAVGVMQVLPTTGRELGFADIHPPEPNIAAGIRYMDRLRRTYFNDPAISPDNQVFFALAGYNAGPNRIARLRTKAPEQGLDPNVWFGNVERIVLQTVGQETVRYVGNIYRYFVMFSAAPELHQ
jgi:membrane-bound lytic murein transglycosylase MltF